MSTRDSEKARGQKRTVETDWSRTAPYIRYRYERALELLPEGGTVFELGCGIGHGIAFLARARPSLRFVGVEASAEAVEFGRAHYGSIKNLALESIGALEELTPRLPSGAFLIALEVLEHLDDRQLEYFKREVMQKVDRIVFSFPYNEQNIDGKEHLQSFDIYSIFEMFPGFQTIFLRRHSIKFIGHWERQPRAYLGSRLGVAREADAIDRLANLGDGSEPIKLSVSPEKVLPRRLRKLRKDPHAFFRDSRIPALRALQHLFRASR